MIYTKKEVTISNEALEAINIMAPSEEVLIFDIETTGFSRQQDHLVSITAAEFNQQKVSIHQWFAQSPADEPDLLNSFNQLQASKPFHITYNGHSFDIPFLYCKYQYYNIFTTLNKSKCCDLYRVSKKTLNLESYKLKRIEEALSIYREDGISGKECIALYQDYLTTQNQESAQLILQHNFEDVLNLIYVSQVLRRLSSNDVLSLLPHKWQIHCLDWYLEALTLKKQHLSIRLVALSGQSDFQLETNQLYLPNGDCLLLESHNGQYHVLIQVHLVYQEIDQAPYLFFNGDANGLAKTLGLGSAIEELLFQYHDQQHIAAIFKLIEVSLRYLIR